MTIPLDDFERDIDKTILLRGQTYFEDGHVLEIEELYPGKYKAVVIGSVEYTVSLQVETNVVIEYDCECLYDLGPVCKHIVAAIFSLQQDVLLMNFGVPEKEQTNDATMNKVTKAAGMKSGTIEQKLNDILSKLSEEEAKSFLMETALKNKTFRSDLFSSYEHLIPDSDISKIVVQREIRSVFKDAGGSRRFIHWRNIPGVVNDIAPYREKAEAYLKADNYRNAFCICAAFLEEVTKALDYADDSSGYLGSQIDIALTMLKNITAVDLEDKLRKEIWKYYTSSFEKKIFSGWDWHLGMLELSAEITKTEAEANAMFDLLEGPFDEYDTKEVQVIKLHLLQKFKGKEAADSFAQSHLSNRKIRLAEIDRALGRKDFYRAKALAKEGIKQDKKNSPGYVGYWYESLLKIGRAMEDRDMIVQNAKLLFFTNHMPREDYYKVLKENVAPAAWPGFVNELITQIESFDGFRNKNLLLEIYIKEEYWQKLLLLISENPTLEVITGYKKYLEKDYAAQLVELYAVAAKKYLEQVVGRKYYKRLAKHLRHMKSLDGEGKLEELLLDLKKIYKMRPALLEELDKV